MTSMIWIKIVSDGDYVRRDAYWIPEFLWEELKYSTRLLAMIFTRNFPSPWMTLEQMDAIPPDRTIRL